MKQKYCSMKQLIMENYMLFEFMQKTNNIIL